MTEQKPVKIIQRNSINLEDIAPPVSAIQALRSNLLLAMLENISTDDMNEIIAKQVDKAKEGDVKSAKLIIDMVQEGGISRGNVTHMQQAIVAGEEKQHRFMTDTREHLALVLQKESPQQALSLAKILHSPLPHVLEALNDHEWFEKTKIGWCLTEQGKKENP